MSSTNEKTVNLTPEQQKVMDTCDKNIIVSASAGSGKTFIMINKIADYIINKGVKIGEVLVLTYTNAAASEMKQKLITSLQDLAEKNPNLIEEIEGASSADISTFDSFCQKLAKRYFYILNIDPSFNIIQGSEQTELEKRAIKKAIKTYKKENSEKYFKLFDSYASNRTDKNIYELILSLYSFECSILDYNEFKYKCCELFNNDGEKATKIVFEKITKRLNSCKEFANQILVEAVNKGYDKVAAAMNERLSYLSGLLCQKTFENLIDETVKDVKFTDFKCASNLDIKAKTTPFRVIFDDICCDLQKFVSSEIYKNSIISCKEITETLLELCEEFVNEYTKLKTAKNVFDYNDIERFTLKLFEDEEILKEIKNSYKQIFVDEFQDANRVQEKILMQLQNDNNLFFVGDLKQAIYGFRQSNSKIFERLFKEFGEDEDNSASLKLNCNFRTTKKVLDFVNIIFDEIMTPNISSVDYKKDAELVANAPYETEKYPTVELSILYGKEEKPHAQNIVYDIKEDCGNKLDDYTCEANYIANKITELLGQEIYDVSLKKYRPIKYKDICLLFKTRTHQQSYIDALNSLGIPTVENSNIDLEETYDIEVLINLLKVSQNYKDDISLSSIMMSNLFNFSPDEMLTIKNDEYTYFYDCVKNYQKEDEICEKIQNMQKKIEKFNKIATFGGINKAFRYILEETNYDYKIGFDANSISRKKNIQDFVDSFINSKYNNSIYEYINFLDSSTREQKVVSKISSDNVCTITTMHSSKGLEWPIIIIPSLGSDFNRKIPNSTESKMVINEDLGIGVKYNDLKNRKSFNNVFYYAIENKNSDDDFSEKLRLFYVALTRAKNRLLLVGSANDTKFQKFTDEYQIRQTNNFLSLIVNSLPENDIEKIVSKIEKFEICGDSAFVCNVVKKEDYGEISNEKLANVMEDYVNEEMLNSYINYVNKPYFNEKSTQIAQKNSVSSILKQQENETSYNSAPQKLTLNEHLSEDIKKNEIGSCYHKVFELFNFNQVATFATVKQTISQIEKQGEFSCETIKSLNINLLINNINIIKQLIGDGSVIKEHTFVMQLPYNEIENSDINDKVLVQGICDLIIIKNNQTILVDYKYSSLGSDKLLQKYKKQLYLYEKAIQYGLNKGNVESYLLSICESKLIKNNTL